MHKAYSEKEDKSVQTEQVRTKRTIFDTVLRMPEDTPQKESSLMPIVDQQVLLESLRAASREGLINRQARSISVSEEGSTAHQRQNDRGPLLKED